MKQVFVFIFLWVCVSCSEKNEVTGSIPADSLANKADGVVVLKDTVHETVTQADSVVKDQGELCTITAVYNTSYCGGAVPPKELLDELAKHHALKNTSITLHVKGTIRNADTRKVIKLDKQGKSSVNLKEGLWEFGLTTDIDKRIAGINPACEIAIQKKYGTFSVKKEGKNNFYLLYHFDCDPCDPDMKKRP
ncbi:MAG TPA: hypothetical protein VK177_00870 [Flavobacteriales bacterium]|nr:hypothetical protein [Flavobacteriales bacterium]